jgi:hypothetical protein
MVRYLTMDFLLHAYASRKCVYRVVAYQWVYTVRHSMLRLHIACQRDVDY